MSHIAKRICHGKYDYRGVRIVAAWSRREESRVWKFRFHKSGLLQTVDRLKDAKSRIDQYIAIQDAFDERAKGERDGCE